MQHGCIHSWMLGMGQNYNEAEADFSVTSNILWLEKCHKSDLADDSLALLVTGK